MEQKWQRFERVSDIERESQAVLDSIKGHDCYGAFGKESHTRHPLDRRVDGPQKRSGLCREEENLFPLSGIKPRASSL
jgi:hypothetical protein